MVSDEVDNGQMILPVRDPETTSQLLQEDHRRLGGSQHQHRVDRRHVEALVEQVDGEEHLDCAVETVIDGAGSRCRRGPSGRRRAGLRSAEEVGHEVGVGGGQQKPSVAPPPRVLPLVERLLCTFLRRDRLRESLGVEAAVSPRDRLVVGDVGEDRSSGTGRVGPV